MAYSALHPQPQVKTRSGRIVNPPLRYLDLQQEVERTRREIEAIEEEIELTTVQYSETQTIPKTYPYVPPRQGTPMPRSMHTIRQPQVSAHTPRSIPMNNPPMPVNSSTPMSRMNNPPVPVNSATPMSRFDTSQATVDALERMTTMLATTLKDNSRPKLPDMEPETFSGDILRFMPWLLSFETLIESHTESGKDRLYYLNKYTGGPAKELISWLITAADDSAYEEAKNLLIERFGDKYRIAEQYKSKLDNWPFVKDGHDLRNFSDFCLQCLSAMSSLSYLQCLDSADENKKLVKKLPSYVTHSWARVVDRWIYGDHMLNYEGRYPPFSEFCKFISSEARVACGPVAVRKSDSSGQVGGNTSPSAFKKRQYPQKKVSSLATNSTEANRDTKHTSSAGGSTKPPCVICKGDHFVGRCDRFDKLPTDDRKDLAKHHGLCYGCFARGHVYRDCKRRNPKLMYGDKPSATVSAAEKASTISVMSHKINTDMTSDMNGGQMNSLIMPVIVYHKDKPNLQIKTYALLDDQSNACFVTDDIQDSLQTPAREVKLQLTTVAEKHQIKSTMIDGLVVRGLSERDEVILPETYTRSSIQVERSLIPQTDTIKNWPHLVDVAQELHPYDKSLDVGMLIGFNCSAALLPRNIVSAGDNDPYGVKTKLGWGVIGIVEPCDTMSNSQNSHFTFRTIVKEVELANISEMFQLDFNESQTYREPVSIEDQRFLTMMKKDIHQRSDGHIEMPLPFKDKDVVLPNNRPVVVKRLQSLKRKLQTKPKFCADYNKSMTDMLMQHYAEPVPEREMENTNVWYVPHHGVYHPLKPDKLRIVFDCSSEYKGTSLNQALLSGPDLTNNLIGVLCRFRQEKVALMCDIQGMFHQVSVNEADRNYLRFLWWKNGNTHMEPSEYRMAVHLFGATSSPACANLALKTVADVYEDEFGSRAADFVRTGFYVDDGMVSVSSVEEGKELYDATVKMCARGGFRLHKLASNCEDIVKTFPEEDRAECVKELLKNRNGSIVGAVGMKWRLESDTLMFRIEIQDKPLSRRGILSTVSSIFDPLGLISPFLLLGKQLLQVLCRNSAKWDDPIPDDIRLKWEKWRLDLMKLSELEVPRCWKPPDFSVVKTTELHYFSDASLQGYGTCVYLRMIDEEDHVATSLVIAKSRVTPSKIVTIPRLELMAAVVSVRVSNFLHKQLPIQNVAEYFWTDSQVVLGYIANEARRFQIYVANRVQQIRDSTSVDQWRYVDTKSNPADKASRGMNADEMFNSSLWWNGPEFLSSVSPFPSEPISDLPVDDPEFKKTTVLAANTQPAKPLDLLDRLEYFSSWHRAKRAIAVCIRFKNILKDRIQGKPRQKESYLPIDIAELQNAEKVILQALQQHVFPNEYSSLKKLGSYARERPRARERNIMIKQNSNLYRLDPYMDHNGLIRVGGRVKRANVPRDLAHPVILPKDCYVTKLVIAHHHTKTCHSGRNTTLNEIRAQGYWILHGRTAVGSYIARCVTCKRLRGPTVGQKMSDLPADRLDPAPPFSHSGVDYFGPYYIREGRSEKKRWGVMFTCLVTRAIHIEIAHRLTTDSFINAYRRFIGRRGPIRTLRSDRGTNFIGAKNELDAALREMSDDRIRRELLNDGCDWYDHKLNFPHASHMGGVWERMIRSARTVLNAILVQHGGQLDDELLHTFMIEAESVVNSRPLTYLDDSSPDSEEPLTPSQILTLKSKVVLPPPGRFVKEDLFCRKRWRRVQFLSDQFWSRWRKEFIPTLQERKKWNKPEENLKEGDIVLLTDESIARCQWPRAVVVETYSSEDSLVRKVKVKTSESSYERPVHKLILLYRPGTGL